MNPYTMAGRKVSTLRPGRRDSRTKLVVVFLTSVLTVLSVLSTGCSSTQDAVAPKQEIIQAPIASAQTIADFVPSLSDAKSRLLPALSDAPSVSRLAATLTALETALSKNDQNSAAQAIADARAITAAYPPAARMADAMELSVIDVTIDRAAQIVGLPALASRIGA